MKEDLKGSLYIIGTDPYDYEDIDPEEYKILLEEWQVRAAKVYDDIKGGKTKED